MTYTEEELNIEKYKLQQVIDAQQTANEELQAKYQKQMKTLLELKNENKILTTKVDSLNCKLAVNEQERVLLRNQNQKLASDKKALKNTLNKANGVRA